MGPGREGGWGMRRREGGREGKTEFHLRVEENETAKKDGQKRKQARLRNKSPEERKNG